MSYYLLYIPLCLVILIVLESCKYTKPKTILRRVAANFLVLTGVLVLGSAILFAVQKWL